MRECAYKAGLLTSLNSQQLEFTTERMSIIIIIFDCYLYFIYFLLKIITIIFVPSAEAAALHCLSVINEHNLQPHGIFFYYEYFNNIKS
jgi:hypothetical protein